MSIFPVPRKSAATAAIALPHQNAMEMTAQQQALRMSGPYDPNYTQPLARDNSAGFEDRGYQRGDALR